EVVGGAPPCVHLAKEIAVEPPIRGDCGAPSAGELFHGHTVDPSAGFPAVLHSLWSFGLLSGPHKYPYLFGCCDWRTCSFAASTMRSGVKPNFVCSSLSGAEAPNVFMPMRCPLLLTYRCQTHS